MTANHLHLSDGTRITRAGANVLNLLSIMGAQYRPVKRSGCENLRTLKAQVKAGYIDALPDDKYQFTSAGRVVLAAVQKADPSYAEADFFNQSVDVDAGLLDGLLSDDELALLERDLAAEWLTEDVSKKPPKRKRVLLDASDAQVLEQAIEATGLENRGEAITEVCRVYLGCNNHG